MREGAATLFGLKSIVPGTRFAIASQGLPYDGAFKPENVASPQSLLIAVTDVTQTGEVIGTAVLAPSIGALALASLDVLIADVNPDIVDRRWLLYRLRCGDYKAFVRGAATGTTVRHLSPQLLGRFALYLPELSAQRAVAAFLGALDDKIELNRRLSATLEELTRTLFAMTFGVLDADRPPEGWAVASLGDHVEVVRGLSYNSAGLSDDGIPLHNLDSIYEGGGYKYEGLKHYRGDHQDRHFVRAGDLLVVNTEQGFDYLLIGFPALVPARFGDTSLYSADLFRMKPSSDSHLTTRFLYLALMSPRLRQLIVGYSNGTTVNHLAADGLKRPRLAVPPADVVQRFDRTIAPLFASREQLQLESETLAQLRDIVLPKLMFGDLVVREAEEAVAETL